MIALQGISVSSGVAIGEALVIDYEGFRIPRRFLMRDAVDDELQRLSSAMEAVAEDIERNRVSIASQLGEKYGAIFAAHLQVLRDERLNNEIRHLVLERHYSPEYAVSRTLRRYAKVFLELDSAHHAERAQDIFDIERSLLYYLLGLRREELSHLTSPVVVLAHNLRPSETAKLNPEFVLGFATEIGGGLSHTAIVAKGLEIPAVVGIGEFLTDVSGGDLVIVDGDHGRIILQPDEETIARYRHEVEEHRTISARLDELAELPAQTQDGTLIRLAANIEFPHEVASCIQRGAEGIGLYRTEFLYLGASEEPTEEDHFQAYSQVVSAMKGHSVVIRTLDLGADKMGHKPLGEEEHNPFLGLRSIRLSLKNVTLFRTQLRAILRASALGQIELMFPLISTMVELRQAKSVLNDVMEDLAEEGIPFDADLKVGMMVEVPAAVMMIDRFLREVDFVSIGTNDLVQYTLAVDRDNKDVADLYQTVDPSVLRLIDATLKSAAEADVFVSVCGEISGQPAFAMLLLGMGVRALSVPPSLIPEIKKLCRSVSVPDCEAIYQCAMDMETAGEIKTYLHEELRKTVPELVPF